MVLITREEVIKKRKSGETAGKGRRTDLPVAEKGERRKGEVDRRRQRQVA